MKKLAIAVMLAVLFVTVQVRAEDCTIIREAFGAAVGFSVYNAQMVVGLTADAYVKKVYTTKYTQTICTEQRNALGLLNEYCIKMEAMGKEVETLKEIEGTIAKLKATIDALDKYTVNSSVANANDFEAKRQASWAAIAKLLDIKT